MIFWWRYLFLDVINNNNNIAITYYSLLQTVYDNRKHYIHSKLKGEEKSRDPQATLVYPSTTNLKEYITKGYIINCPVTIDDIEQGKIIYGLLVPLL